MKAWTNPFGDSKYPVARWYCNLETHIQAIFLHPPNLHKDKAVLQYNLSFSLFTLSIFCNSQFGIFQMLKNLSAMQDTWFCL